MKNRNHKKSGLLHECNKLPHRACQLLFQVLELLRKTVKNQFTDWKDADDWIFSELDITKSELRQIYDGRDTLYNDASAVDDSEWVDKPLTKDELITRSEKPVWAIALLHRVDPDIPSQFGWGIVPAKESFRQYLTQDFYLGTFRMEDYETKWVAFDEEQPFVRYFPAEEKKDMPSLKDCTTCAKQEHCDNRLNCTAGIVPPFSLWEPRKEEQA